VVTRTRRRSASRPAGPPEAVAVPAMASSGHGTERDGEENAHAHVEHVPIKRKGSRKR
jgi:ribonuclease E